LLDAPACSLAELRRVLHAHRLASAESFTELLSMSRLIGVERHGYQIETVHRVLRTLRGRALQSDEVGLVTERRARGVRGSARSGAIVHVHLTKGQSLRTGAARMLAGGPMRAAFTASIAGGRDFLRLPQKDC
jgi:hypothetical protein